MLSWPVNSTRIPPSASTVTNATTDAAVCEQRVGTSGGGTPEAEYVSAPPQASSATAS